MICKQKGCLMLQQKHLHDLLIGERNKKQSNI